MNILLPDKTMKTALLALAICFIGLASNSTTSGLSPSPSANASPTPTSISNPGPNANSSATHKPGPSTNESPTHKPEPSTNASPTHKPGTSANASTTHKPGPSTNASPTHKPGASADASPTSNTLGPSTNASPTHKSGPSAKASPTHKPEPSTNASPTHKPGPSTNALPTPTSISNPGPNANSSPTHKPGPSTNESPTHKPEPSTNESPTLKPGPSTNASPTHKPGASADASPTSNILGPSTNASPTHKSGPSTNASPTHKPGASADASPTSNTLGPSTNASPTHKSGPSAKASPTHKPEPSTNASPTHKPGPSTNALPTPTSISNPGPNANSSPTHKPGPSTNESPTHKPEPSTNESPTLKPGPSTNASPTHKPGASADASPTSNILGPSTNASPTHKSGPSTNASPTHKPGASASASPTSNTLGPSTNASPTHNLGASADASPTSNTLGHSANASPTSNTLGPSTNASPTHKPGPSANASPTHNPGPSENASPTSYNPGASANALSTLRSGTSKGGSRTVKSTSTSGLGPAQTTTPPHTIPPHPEKANFNLGFSLKIDATFSKDLDDKTSPNYMNYSAAFRKVITKAFVDVPGFRQIIIKGFRNGSIICDYTAVFGATTDRTQVVKEIRGSVKGNLQKAKVSGHDVNSNYLEQNINEGLNASKNLMSDICRAEGICDIGYNCSLDHKKVTCTSNCNNMDCGSHGVCQFKVDGQPICRCKKHPKYVYSGDRCEITGEQLLLKSEYIAAIAGGAGGGLVLILVIALICTCVRKRKAKEKRDGPLSAYDEGTRQHWTSRQDGPKGYNNQSYETIEMDHLPIKREKPSLNEEPFSVYQPSNISRPITRASAEFASFMDEGSTSMIHAPPIKTRTDTNYASHHGHDGPSNRNEDARREAGYVSAAAQADILNDVRRHDRMREDHYRTGAERSLDTNRLASVVSGSHANIKEQRRENISVTQNTPQMQIQNPSSLYPSLDHLRRNDYPSVHRQEQSSFRSRDHLRRGDSPSIHRQEEDFYPSRDHPRRDDYPSLHRQEQDVYPSRDHPKRDEYPPIHRQEQDGFRSHDQRDQDIYVPKDRNLERLHREERMSSKHGRHESFGNDRRSFREADRVQQTPVPSPKPRPKTFGDFRHPHSFITVPEPDYGVEHGSGMEHDRGRPSQDNESRDGGQHYRTENHGRVNDSSFARDLQRRGQEIKRSEGRGAKDRLREPRDRRGQWEHSDRRSENWSRHGRDGNEGLHSHHF
ncbi:mucin-3A-like [Haliotis asinina]|uniref:mucin-3A-like n=1 Tax=Haliotis asinina TaxID=109174 RepID=UPI003531C6C5